MTGQILSAVRKLQEFILEAGLARGVLALPAPRMLALTSGSSVETDTTNVFTFTITEPEIESVARDLFASGHYSLAVQEAYKAIDHYVSERCSHDLSGTQLMETVFSPSKPVLSWSERATTSQVDEQRGYQRLFSGAMLGIRNPVAHEFNWVEDPELALELLVFAQHLLRKAKSATLDIDLPQKMSSS